MFNACEDFKNRLPVATWDFFTYTDIFIQLTDEKFENSKSENFHV